MDKRPSDFHLELTEDRIQEVSQLIFEARTHCLEYHDEVSGDSGWSYGCRAREWTRQKLRLAAASGKYPYLSIIEDVGQMFTIGIGGIPIKAFRDDSDEPAPRVRKRSAAELAQLSLFKFDGTDTPVDVAWRLVIDIDKTSLEVLRVTFVGLDQDGDTVCYHNVQLKAPVTKIYDATATKEEGVELKSPKVEKKRKDEQIEDEAANGE